VRKAGQRVRITGHLIDASTGNHIWADRFDGAIDDIVELQDQVASSVVGAIEPRLRQSEIERAARKPTERLDAYDLYLRALAQTYRYTAEGVGEAVVLLRRALAIDPSYGLAAAMVGRCLMLQRVQGWAAVSDDDIVDGVRVARQALEAARNDPDVMWQAAWRLFFFARETAMAVVVLDRALTLNHRSSLDDQRLGLRAAQPARGGDRSLRPGIAPKPVRSAWLFQRRRLGSRSSRCETL
jgi:hypothetical protein